MSVTEPALQTLPREKGNVRGAFIARPGHQLIFADFGQQELRVLAHYMSWWDITMAEILSDPDNDLHMESAIAIYGRPEDEITKQERTNAKNVNFALTYGAGQKKLCKMLGVGEDEGKRLLKRYYRKFPGIWDVRKSAERQMATKGYVVTAFGRRHRRLDPNGKQDYKAVNSLVQGCSADQTKTALVNLHRQLNEQRMQSKVLLAVHDEIIVEAPDEEVEAPADLVRQCMTDFPQLKVPFLVDVNIATRWSEAK